MAKKKKDKDNELVDMLLDMAVDSAGKSKKKKSTTKKSTKTNTTKSAVQKSAQKKANSAVNKAAKKVVKSDGYKIALAVVAAAVLVTIVCLFVFQPAVIFDVVEKAYVLFIKEDAPQDPGSSNISYSTYDGALKIHFINVGQGDCIYIQLPDSKDMLIDSGNSSNSGEYKASMLSYLHNYNTDGEIDYLMATHGDSDHIYYMDEIFDEFQVNCVYMPFILSTPSSASWATKVDALTAAGISSLIDTDTIGTACYAAFFVGAFSEPDCEVHFNVGQFDIIGNSYAFEFYGFTNQDWLDNDLSSAEEKNAVSPIGILEYNNRRIVLTGDSNEINEPMFMNAYSANHEGATSVNCDVLKVGHHGSATSSTGAFLDYIDCEYAVISCNAAGNTFRHPRQVTLSRLTDRNMSIYRTDLNGTIVMSITETNIEFSVETEASDDALRTGYEGGEAA